MSVSPITRTKPDCLFCQIVAGDISSTKIYEDDFVYAFEDINPEAAVHILVVPKAHYDSLIDDVPDELLGQIMRGVAKVAELKDLDQSGFRVVINTGEHARQTVFHLHAHILGGERLPIHLDGRYE